MVLGGENDDDDDDDDIEVAGFTRGDVTHSLTDTECGAMHHASHSADGVGWGGALVWVLVGAARRKRVSARVR